MKYNPITAMMDENLITSNKITSMLKGMGLTPYTKGKSGRIKGMSYGYGDFSIIKPGDKFIVEITTNPNQPSYTTKLNKVKEALKDYDNVTVR